MNPLRWAEDELLALHGKLVAWWYTTLEARRIASWASHYLVVRVAAVGGYLLAGRTGAQVVGALAFAFYLLREAIQHRRGGLKDGLDRGGDVMSAALGFADALAWL